MRGVGGAALLCALAFAAPEAGEVPEAVRRAYRLDPFYAKYVDAGVPVVASAKVPDAALLEAAWLIGRMLEGRGDILEAMARRKVRCTVMAYTEMTTDVPEHRDLAPKAYWDRRARGLGATAARPCVSCAEENLLGYPGDPYAAENILIHEFAHAVHEMGLDAKFDRRLRKAYAAAMEAGLWKGTYAATDHKEYWAEGVQSWFDTNRENDDEHNHVNTREELKEYDPTLAGLVAEVYGDRPWRYVRPRDRAEPGHLAGHDPEKAPVFRWPDAVPEDEKELRRLPPKRERRQVSKAGGPATSIRFVNRTEQSLEISWLDFEGKRRKYADLRPGAAHVQPTHAGHAWVVADPAGKVVALVVAVATPGLVTLE